MTDFVDTRDNATGDQRLALFLDQVLNEDEEDLEVLFNDASQTVLANIQPEDDNFDCCKPAINFINSRFPNEQSLANVDECVAGLKSEVQKIDSEILESVRGQAESYVRAKDNLYHVKAATGELLNRISSMQVRAEKSESLIDEISQDVKNLDNAKNNLMTTITALKRVVMFVSAVDQLRISAAERNYIDSANLILAANLLAQHFSDLKHVPRIMELLSQKNAIYTELEKQVLEDFDAIFDPDQDVIPNLHDACLTVDAMSAELRRDIITKFSLKLLEPYKKIFQPPQEASCLEMVERRYTWFKRCVRDYEEKFGATFPFKWHVQRHLAEHFCHITRQHLVEVLGNCHHIADPLLVLRVLQKSTEFENALSQKFEIKQLVGDEMDEMMSELEERESTIAVKRLPATLQYPEILMEDQAATHSDSSSPLANTASHTKKNLSPLSHLPRFKGIISECFEAYLGSWIRFEEQQLSDVLAQATSPGQERRIGDPDETISVVKSLDADDEENDTPRIMYSSASELFSAFNVSLKRAAAVSTHQTLVKIFQVFKRVVKRYVDILGSRISKRDTIISDEQMKEICCVVGTIEYSDSTLPDLVAVIVKCFDDSPPQVIHFDAEREALWNLKAQCIDIFVSSLELSLDPFFNQITCTDWRTLTGVVDDSSYITGIIDILDRKFSVISSHSSFPYFRFFCDKFVQSLIAKYISTIYSCQGLNEIGAQQLQIDTHRLKAKLLEAPAQYTHGRPVPSGYSKYVTREMDRVETLLKVLISSADDPEALRSLVEDSCGLTSAVRDGNQGSQLTKLFAIKPDRQGQQIPDGGSRHQTAQADTPNTARTASERQHSALQSNYVPSESYDTPAPFPSGAVGDSSSSLTAATGGSGEAWASSSKFALDFQSFSAFGENFKLQSLRATEDVKKLFNRF